ncbi:MAG TPA: acetylglucosamine transferase, partial [Rhodocyclaceae bacterium]|nr:acetylglucosamine transferase [Rhodocyclaceae bacterium]
YSRHDRSRFKVHAYSVGAVDRCFERERVQAGVDVFRDLDNMPAQAAAQLIVNDGIDILIDLSGYARHARPEILALRPAPLQLSNLGFQGTLGAAYIDYALLDRNILLPEIRQFWDEKIAYLPHCSYHCETPVTTAQASRTDEGLPEHSLVLGALHHPRKLEPDSFRVWLSLLHELPEAVLWLQYETQEQRENLKCFAEAHGVLEGRLVFSPMAGYEKHLARLRLADICLDTFTYNGHTTTVESLGMGVPVVTLKGQGVVARIASSMLTAHGLPDLTASTVEEYNAIVHKLARDTAWRDEVKKRIGDYAHSNLFCPERRVREIETAYEMIWARHQAGLAPDDFDVPPFVA